MTPTVRIGGVAGVSENQQNESADAWAQVAAHIAKGKASTYDAAIDLIVELREVTNQAEFRARLWSMRRKNKRKRSFIERLDRAGM